MLTWLNRSFSRRLTALLCLSSSAALGLTMVFVTHEARSHLVAQLADSLQTQARLAALGRPAPAQDLGRACGCRVTLIAADGRVLADNEIPAGQLAATENHKDRPEVREALEGRVGQAVRHSRTLGIDFLYTAVPWPMPDKTTGAARLALPLTEVDAKVAQLRDSMLWTALAVIVLSLLAGLWLSAALARPVTDMCQVAERIAGGDYGARVRQPPADEHGRLAETLNLLAERVDAQVRELSREKAELASILTNMVEAVVAVDGKGRIRAANPALGALFGISETEASGKPLLETLRHAEIDRLLRAVITDGQPRGEEIRLYAPDERVFEAHAAPLDDGALLVLHDITRLRRLEVMRRDFVANVSHELRTPLASIKGFAETLRAGAMDDRSVRDDFLGDIEKNADRLTALVDDLLDLSAIESGKRRPTLEECSLLELALEACSALRPAAERQRVALEVVPDGWMPTRADAKQMRQVLTNLLDNAVKFNKAGGKVVVTARADAQALTVAVVDTGIGIPEDSRARVFERFYRVDKARSREMGGTGLGLSIVKHIVEAHGGGVAVSSVPGQGSTFSFTVPLSPPPSA